MKSFSLRLVPAAAALAVAGLAANAFAQNTTPPADKPTVVEKVENSRPVQATERGVTRAANATKRGVTRAANATKRGTARARAATARAAHRTADTMRNTGDKISEKLPPPKQ